MQYKILKNDTVLLSQPYLIDELGRGGAQFLSQIHYWLQNDKIGTEHNSKRWIYNTANEWAEQLRLSVRTVRRYIQLFLQKNIISVEKLSSHKSNRTNYITINYETLKNIEDKFIAGNVHGDKMSRPLCKNVTMVIQKITNKNLNNKSKEILLEPQQVEQVRDLEKNELKKENLEKGLSLSSSSSKQLSKNTTVQDMIKHWNKAFPKSEAKLSKNLSQNMMGAFIHRFEKNVEKWQHYCDKILSSSYLMGESFVLSLNWALKFSTIDRVLKNDLGVKDIQFVPSAQTLEEKALEHIDGVGESDACKQDRRLILKTLGAASYVSWFTQVDFIEQEGGVVLKARNKFVEDYVFQKFGLYLKKNNQFLSSIQ